MVFACLAEFRKKIRNLNCNGYMQPEILLPLLTHGQDSNAFFDLNNCRLHGIRCSSFWWDKHKKENAENTINDQKNTSVICQLLFVITQVRLCAFSGL
jgi:hypothetical protein